MIMVKDQFFSLLAARVAASTRICLWMLLVELVEYLVIFTLAWTANLFVAPTVAAAFPEVVVVKGQVATTLTAALLGSRALWSRTLNATTPLSSIFIATRFADSAPSVLGLGEC